MAEQKLKGTEAEEKTLAKYESTTSGASRLAAGTWRGWGRGSRLWSLLRWCQSQARAGWGTMGPWTARTAMQNTTLGIRGRATTPIPRFADNLWIVSSSRLSQFISKFATPTSRGACRVEIEELHVHVGPIGQIGRCRMLAKGPIICQPDSVAELLICVKYQQLILT